MASLKDGMLELDFRFLERRTYKGESWEWFYYQIRFLWNGTTMINPKVLEPMADDVFPDWPEGTVFIRDWDRNGMISLLEAALIAERVFSLEPIYPDIEVTVSPGNYSGTSVLMRLNSNMFKDEGVYTASGLCLRLEVSREELKQFVDDLKKELAELPRVTG